MIEVIGKAEYKLLEHKSATTSEESSKLRNTPLSWGTKTMIIKKPDDTLVMLIYPADKKLSWGKVKKIPIVGKKFERADKFDKVRQGAVPPFPKLFNMSGVLD